MDDSAAMCLYAMCMLSACGSQMSLLDPLDLEFHVVVLCHVSAGN